jgi:cytochrome bd-type quinol oxidase subunit 2
MKKTMRAPIAVAIAIAVGLVVLAGYFIPWTPLQNIQTVLLSWGVILVGVATLVGITNLVIVHIKKAGDKKAPDRYSILLLVVFAITLGAGLWLTPGDSGFQHVVTSIQTPIETSLLAILTVTLAFAALRMLQRRKGWTSVLFVVSVIVFLIISGGLVISYESMPFVGGLITFIRQIPVAGARGILLGIALGSVLTGLRILMGADRPYSG